MTSARRFRRHRDAHNPESVRHVPGTVAALRRSSASHVGATHLSRTVAAFLQSPNGPDMSLFRRSSPRTRPADHTTVDSSEADPPVKEVTLLIENADGKRALIERAARALPEDEVLVEVRDLVGERRSFGTVPQSPNARIVAREAPVVLRGGLTSLVAYYRVPANELQAREEHFEAGNFSHAYDVSLRVVSRGRAAPTPKTAVVA